MILAAITLKIGAYGFVRFILPILPDASRYLTGFVIALSLIAIVYIGFVALMQADMKRLIAYSSIAHMGFVTLGFFMFSQLGVEGGLVQMISHGFVSAALFLCVGVMYDRMHTHRIADFGGVVNTMPKFAALHDAVLDGQCRTAGDVGVRRRVPGDPRVRSSRTSGSASRAATTMILGRRVHAVDVQARHLRRRSPTTTSRS